MKWDQAKTHELYVIAFDDPHAEPLDIYEAKNEINRRKKQRHARLQQKEKVHYSK